MEIIDKDLKKKLMLDTTLYIDRFSSNASNIDEAIDNCKLVSIDYYHNMRHNQDNASRRLTEEVNGGRITYDEETYIRDKMQDLEMQKVRKFLDGLKKCGCKFK